MAVTAVGPATRDSALAPARAWCREYARAHQENFTVVSWLLPRDLRPHFYALYAFCRWTDDLGDEAEGDRLALLGAWECSLRACFEGTRVDPLFIALGDTVDRCELPIGPFLRLIEANRMDQTITCFETYADLLDYCEHSATPVGHMVLHVLGYHDERRQRLADATCIALQLANFLQDVAVDSARGRSYIPREDLNRFDGSRAAIAHGQPDAAFRALMEFEVARTRALFAQGKELESLVDGRSRLDIRLFRLGGEAILDAIEAAGYDVLTRRPTIPRRKKAWMAVSSGVRLKFGFQGRGRWR